MGQVFRYVSDDALLAGKCEHPCPLCGATEDVYPIYADIPGPNEEGPGPISEACIQCIRALPLEAISTWQTERAVLAHLRSSFPALGAEELEERRVAICQELRRTPRLPVFVQDDEWPFCCGDLAEFVGGEDMSLTRIASLGGISVFRCPRCGKEQEVFQST
jgi:hypothetical protein